MRVVVLTRNPRGMASRFLARWGKRGVFDVVAVLLDEGIAGDRRTRARRRWRRLRRVGPGGLAVGLALSRAYSRAGGIGASHVEQFDFPVVRQGDLSGAEARAALVETAADIAVSLGNGYLPESTFSIPRLGTLNVHLGAVPGYRGGPPIFWELHDQSDRVGYTVHQMDAGIDTGPVLAAGDVPIRRRETLELTLCETLPHLHNAAVDALAAVLEGLSCGNQQSSPQTARGERLRSAPGLGDYVRVRRSLAYAAREPLNEPA
jgi:folate-dependent phosphoribosylglycinamide formyltransferase PurN